MKLQQVVPWGRNANEYKKMFLLGEEELNSKILGCSDGPSSFNAQMNDEGISITSVDPLYAFSTAEIQKRIDETAEIVIKELSKEPQNYLWNEIKNVNELKQTRLKAMDLFLSDYDLGKAEKRYIDASLPDLPFEEENFDLALCSHFLFLYTEHYDYDFHADAIFELLRVASEVRIFPLVSLDGTFSPFVEPLIDELEEEGFMCAIKTTHYEFQKGANQMLVIN